MLVLRRRRHEKRKQKQKTGTQEVSGQKNVAMVVHVENGITISKSVVLVERQHQQDMIVMSSAI